MTLTSALSSANSGLSAASRRASITANNIANATTPGYVRRRLVVAENILNGTGQGVNFVGIERTQDIALSREKRLALGASEKSNIIANAYNDLNREMGLPGDSFGLFSSYQGLETSLRELAVTPESFANQNAVYNDLNTLTRQFSDLHRVGINLRENADNAIARSVRDVNKGLHKIAELNEQIAGIVGSGDGAAALEDERQRILDEIAKIIPIKDIPRDGGQIEIVTREGIFLLTGNVHELNFTPSGVIPAGVEYDPNGGLLSGLSVNGQELTPGQGGFAISSGSLAGHFAVRDKIAPDFLSRLDTLAADIVNRFSDSAVDPTLGAGAPGILTDNGNTVDPLNIAGIASRLRINAAIDPSQGGTPTRLRDGIGAATTGPTGNADILNNLLEAFTKPDAAPTDSGLLGDHSSIELAAGLSSLIGEARVNADAVAASTFSRATVLADAELSKTGVNTDEEMQTLLLIEQAYAANARVIQTVSEMLDILMQI